MFSPKTIGYCLDCKKETILDILEYDSITQFGIDAIKEGFSDNIVEAFNYGFTTRSVDRCAMVKEFDDKTIKLYLNQSRYIYMGDLSLTIATAIRLKKWSLIKDIHSRCSFSRLPYIWFAIGEVNNVPENILSKYKDINKNILSAKVMGSAFNGLKHAKLMAKLSNIKLQCKKYEGDVFLYPMTTGEVYEEYPIISWCSEGKETHIFYDKHLNIIGIIDALLKTSRKVPERIWDGLSKMIKSRCRIIDSYLIIRANKTSLSLTKTLTEIAAKRCTCGALQKLVKNTKPIRRINKRCINCHKKAYNVMNYIRSFGNKEYTPNTRLKLLPILTRESLSYLVENVSKMELEDLNLLLKSAHCKGITNKDIEVSLIEQITRTRNIWLFTTLRKWAINNNREDLLSKCFILACEFGDMYTADSILIYYEHTLSKNKVYHTKWQLLMLKGIYKGINNGVHHIINICARRMKRQHIDHYLEYLCSEKCIHMTHEYIQNTMFHILSLCNCQYHGDCMKPICEGVIIKMVSLNCLKKILRTELVKNLPEIRKVLIDTVKKHE